MKLYTALIILLSIHTVAHAQQYLNYQLRLEPVWSRVADSLGEPGSVESVEFSRDGKFIVSGTKYDNSVIMWRTSDGQELWRAYANEEVERVGWSADGQWVAAASEDYVVTVYDAKSGEVYKVLQHDQGIDGLIWSNSGSFLATGEEMTKKDDGTTEGWVRVFNMSTGELVTKLNHGNTVNELFFSADDKYLLAVGHGAVKVYEVGSWKLLQTLKRDYHVIFTSGTFSPDAKYVIAVGQGNGARGTCYLWEWETGKLKKRFNHTGKKIESIAWHPNGDYIAHAGHDPHIFVYRVDDILNFGHDQIRIAHKVWASDHAEYIDFNTDGSFLASAHQNGLIKLWVWMGEDPELNERRHSWVKTQQSDAK